VVQGVARYVRQCPGSRLGFIEDIYAHINDPHLNGVRGLVVQMLDPRMAPMYASLGVPVVNVADNDDDRTLPIVMSDNRAIGVMAAEHLLDLGYRHFAFCGRAAHWYAHQRLAGFAERVGRAGHTVQNTWADDAYRRGGILGAWLRRLPRPVGLMAENDQWAFAIMQRCREERLEVPRDVAVIGVDNDESICEACDVPITSVAVNAVRVGYEAAALIDRILAGEPAPAQPILIPPLGIESRESTWGLAIRDTLVAKAVTLIREHLDQPPSVDELAAELGVSGRQLTRRFHEVMGRTPAEEIRQLRIERAKQLLQATNRKILDIALACGFNDASHLAAAFRNAMGMSPTTYRRLASPTERPERADVVHDQGKFKVSDAARLPVNRAACSS